MPKKQPHQETADGPTFEGAVAELEQIVRRLEAGEMGLNEALEQYEKGVHLLRRCYDLLRRAERRIELLSGVDAEGNPVATPMEDSAPALEERAAGRGRSKDRSSLLPSDEGVAEDDIGVDAPEGLF